MEALERKPCVKGQFYPGSMNALLAMLTSLEQNAGTLENIEGEILGFQVPHAGYVYSGKTAMTAFRYLRRMRAKKFVILGPNHASQPYYSAIYPSGSWQTPLGSAIIDSDLSLSIKKGSSRIVVDSNAHAFEHSLEVQVPFLQYFLGESFTFSPIIMGNQEKKEAVDLARVLSSIDSDFTLISSSDLTHYESLKSAERKDAVLIDAILALDVDRFYSALEEFAITACGFGPIAVLMEFTRLKGGKLKLLEHTTSYDYSRDPNFVVGYSAIVSQR